MEYGGSTREPIVAALTAPGQPFEVTEEVVDGIPMRVFAGQPQTLRGLLEHLAQFGDRPFTIYEDDQQTFAQTYRTSVGLARLLLDEYGLQKGDRIAIAMRNYPEWIPIAFAGWAAGLVVVPLNAWWTPDELAYAIGNCEPKVVFADAERIAGLNTDERGPDAPPRVEVRGSKDTPGVRSWEDVLAALDPDATMPDVEVLPDDEATILYTSGTTGRPKGAVGTHRNHVTNVLNMALGGAVGLIIANGGTPPAPNPDAPQTGALCTFALFHIAGMSTLMASAYAGGKLVTQYKWNAPEAIELIKKHGITGVGGVPTVVRQLVEEIARSGEKLPTVTGMSIGGAPAPPALIGRIENDFASLVAPGNGYGLTETTSAVVSNSGQDYFSHPDSVGRCMPGADIRVVDPATGEDAEPEQIGELWFRGPNVVRGYWNNPDATASAFTDGWFHTGDLGRVVDGWVYVVDRIKDVIIRGGENIYCAEVEARLLEHPAVGDAALVGVPDEVLGEQAAAVVHLRPGMSATADEIKQFVGESLAAFKVPAYVVFHAEPLPRTQSGKILKRELREPVAESIGSTG